MSHMHNPAGLQFHSQIVLAQWDSLIERLTSGSEVILDGESLDIPSVVAVARYVNSKSSTTQANVPADMEERHF